MTRQAKNNSRRENVKVQVNGFSLEGDTLYLAPHTEHQPWYLCSYFQPQSVISGAITEPRALTNLKFSGLQVKQKCMLIFTVLYKIQKINLLSALLIPPPMLG